MKDVWTEKYRPKNLSEVVGQEDVVSRLKSYVATGSFPHLMFAGPPGTGKTTCAMAFTKEVCGDDWKGAFLELNASDERGIQVVRTKIKDFARTATFGEMKVKFIFLDEADALTSEAQAALRRTMEKFTQTCRFILSCNYSSKIIEPIQSRCAVFRFRNVQFDRIRGLLDRIAGEEDLTITDDGYAAIEYICAGDLRKAVNSLQLGATMDRKITGETLYKTTSTARPEDIEGLLHKALEGDFLEAREHLDKLLIEYGLSPQDVLRQIHKAVFNLNVPEDRKVELVDKVGEADFRLVEGSNPRIQLEALLARFVLVGNSLKHPPRG